MRIRITLAFAISALLASATASSQSRVAGDRPECVEVSAQPRVQAYGFDHVVSVRNTCNVAVVCQVRTDVNPQPSTARLGPGSSTDVLMWRGSPARQFTATVDCTQGR